MYVRSTKILFAGETHLITNGDDLEDMYDTVNLELSNIAEGLKVHKLSLNVKITRFMMFSSNSRATRNHNIDAEENTKVSATECLSVSIDNKPKWRHYIKYFNPTF